MAVRSGFFRRCLVGGVAWVCAMASAPAAAFAMLSVGGFSQRCSMNLSTGAAALVGTIGANGLRRRSTISLRGIFADGFETLR